MQHLDEGTIHAWLDGALPPDEATRVESHAAECEQCAAAVAEARGFIAASSRILTALDNAPRGVIPMQRPMARSRFTPAWKAAAAVLVVALGSVAIRNALTVNESSRTPAVALDSVSSEKPQSTASVRTENSVSSQAAAPKVLMQAQPQPSQSKSVAIASPRQAPAPVRERSIQVPSNAAAPVAAPSLGRAEGMNAADAASAMNKVAAATEDCVGCDTQPLRIIRVDSTRTQRRTVYEVSPNEVVTLVETDSAASIALTGVTTTGMAAEGAAKTMDTRRVAAPAPRANVATPAAPPPLTAQAGAFAMREQTIEWKDAATGRVLRLTGRLPAERLQEIRKRIERERETKKSAEVRRR